MAPIGRDTKVVAVPPSDEKEPVPAMSPITLKAHFDGEHIVLDEPFELPANTPLAVTVLPTEKADFERAGWVAISEERLAAAYGDDEPEYSAADLKS